jgi:hypothetical protein
MQDDLTRAQRYRALAEQMESLAILEPDEARRDELKALAQQYRKLADNLIHRH